MAKLYNLARMTTATTGTGTITLGSAVGSYLSFSGSGVADGDTVSYAIEDGAHREAGRGVYASSGTTLTRTVLKSTNSNTAISLSGTAEVFITALAEDFMAGDGSASAPGIAFESDTNTGFFRPGADTLAAVTGGTERLVIDDSGRILIGGTASYPALTASAQPFQVNGVSSSTSGYSVARWSADSVGGGTFFAKSRGAAIGTHALLSDSDGLGRLTWTGSDGTQFIPAAAISANVDGTPGTSDMPGRLVFLTTTDGTGSLSERMRITSAGNVGIGTPSPGYQLELSTDSAAKPSTNTWTISSDERLKENIVLADLARCWEIVKGVPLKRYTWRSDVYTTEQTPDRSKLGWIAQDVQPFFARAVVPHVFHRPPVDDGVEEYTEQDTVERTVERQSVEIELRNGVPTRVVKTVTETVEEPAFDMVAVVDEAGAAVLNDDGTTLLHPVPRMVTRTRPKKRVDTIADCLSLNSDQIYAAMYGALQLAMNKLDGGHFAFSGRNYRIGMAERATAGILAGVSSAAVAYGFAAGDYRWLSAAADFEIKDATGFAVKMDATEALAFAKAALVAAMSDAWA